ncbi:uncharacterized protein MCAP_0864-like [Panonychus citri]|uniref:uncharacterized protein MCAP_0864-like n=1 Tax=Panonychus citri TaxID=50023 RepID=UPI0023075731|nr:uncharacterized protein MCAP_0864-like [Panonychus citri]
MWNQPDEYFLEVVSNSSMEHFPENTLAKFSNKLPYPIQLDGEWVVAIQEIFYPVDVKPSKRNLTVQLLTHGLTDKLSKEIEIDSSDDLNMIISTINKAFMSLFFSVINETDVKEGKVKRSTDDNFVNPDLSTLTLEKLNLLPQQERESLLQRVKKTTQMILENLKKEMYKYKLESTDKQEKINKLNSSLRQYVDEVAELKKEIKQKQLKDKDLIKESHQNKQLIEDKNSLIKQLEGRIDDLHKKNEENKNMVKTVKSENQLLDGTIAQKSKEMYKLTEEYKTQNKNLSDKLEKLLHEKIIIQKNSNGDTKVVDEIKKLNDEIVKLTEEKQKAELDFKNQKSQTNVQINELTLKYNSCKQTEHILESNLKSQQQDNLDQIKKSQQEINTLKSERSKLKEELTTMTFERSQLQSEIMRLQEKEVDFLSQLQHEKEKTSKLQQDTENNLKELELERQKLQNQENLLLKRLSELGIVLKDKKGEAIINVDDTMTVPGITHHDGKIIVFPGRHKDRIFTPYFSDVNFISSLGFDANSYLNMIEAFNRDQRAFTAPKNCNLNFRSHLMFIHSDIVEEHFVGNKSARVMRVVPIKYGVQSEMVHEKFLKPFYYPVRSNRIEDINFVLSDEMGEPVKFNSGRVLVGLHIKRN